MSESVTSLLVGGMALQRGANPLDDPAGKYAKDLAGSPYGDTSIRHLLRMSSGLRFHRALRRPGRCGPLRASAWAIQPRQRLRSITDRHAPAGEKFVYASAVKPRFWAVCWPAPPAGA